jgi:acyl-CoA reductase-like NAD-dependent aldehyde dehydrogenase
MSDRISVTKTYKMYVNGAFPRSESGRTFVLNDSDGRFLANVAQGSRKDIRDAVVAARGASAKWKSATAYNRGQVLYRVAEILESRRDEFIHLLQLTDGVSAKKATAEVARSIDLTVWYAGWTDKISQILGGTNPVAGPYFNFSIPAPCGVVGVITPSVNSLSGFLGTVLPALASGNTVVVVPGRHLAIPIAVTLGEVCATSDVPPGVVNIVTGTASELAPVLADHEDVDGLDLAGAGDACAELSRRASATITRVVESPLDDLHDLKRLRTFIDTVTVWHSIGQ